MSTRLQVLIVEDSEDDAVLVVRELRRSGYDPTFERVDTPEAMVRALQRQGWDIVIADYSMPRFDGLAALALVQETGLDIPFIIVSGNIGEDVAVAAMRAGAQDYLMKDNLARLGAAVRRELQEAATRGVRRRVERSLQESQERYRTLVDTSPDAIVLADLEGMLLVANQQAARLYGVDRSQELIGVTIPSLMVPEDRERAVSDMKRFASGESGRNIEYSLLQKGGAKIPVALNVSVLRDAAQNPTAMIGVMRDITQQKEAEEELTRRNKELITLYEAARAISSDLSLDAVLETVSQQMTHALDSQRCILSLWDRERDQIEVLLDYHPDRLTEEAPARRTYRLEEYAAARQVLETRSPVVLRGDDPLESGFREGQSLLIIPLMSRDQVLGLAELLNGMQTRDYSPADIRLAQSLASQAAVAVENAQLYQQRRHQANKLAVLLEIGHEITAISAAPDLPGLLERIATHAQELLEADGSDVYLLEPDGEFLRAIVSLGEYSEEMLAKPLTVGEGIVGAVAQNGVAEVVNDVTRDPRSVQIPGTPDESHALMCAPLVSRGRVTGVMALERTGERRGFAQADLDFLVNLARQASIAIENVRMYSAEQQRTEALTKALHQQRDLDGLKDQFVQNVTHELRTPLSIIQGYIQLLGDEALGELLPEQREAVSIIGKRAAGLQRLCDDLTTMLQTQAQVPKRVSVDFGQLAHELIADFKLEAKSAGLRLLADIDPDLPMLQGDPDHLRQVLDNLISNAIKFTPTGGRVTVRLEPVGESIVVEVRDTGVGIPPDQLGDVFRRFYQIDGSITRRYGGTGLGLALVKEVVEAHDGTIEVESEPGKGSLFRVRLPTLA